MPWCEIWNLTPHKKIGHNIIHVSHHLLGGLYPIVIHNFGLAQIRDARRSLGASSTEESCSMCMMKIIQRSTMPITPLL